MYKFVDSERVLAVIHATSLTDALHHYYTQYSVEAVVEIEFYHTAVLRNTYNQEQFGVYWETWL